MNLQLYFLLREVRQPNRLLRAGLLLHASDPRHYVVHTALEQWGTVFHREPGTLSGPGPGLDERRTVRRELKELVRHALAAATARYPDRKFPAGPDDY